MMADGTLFGHALYTAAVRSNIFQNLDWRSTQDGLDSRERWRLGRRERGCGGSGAGQRARPPLFVHELVLDGLHIAVIFILLELAPVPLLAVLRAHLRRIYMCTSVHCESPICIMCICAAAYAAYMRTYERASIMCICGACAVCMRTCDRPTNIMCRLMNESSTEITSSALLSKMRFLRRRGASGGRWAVGGGRWAVGGRCAAFCHTRQGSQRCSSSALDARPVDVDHEAA